ncbi:MAG: tRNA 2-thiouridine(34) synthase MnmA [bacterium]|nr:tRNA 2-thiouridine(34) synthase MnmA [bacterium]
MAKKTVFVGMSGGVDSSVSAGLLKEQGYNVVGVHLKCWNVDGCADQDAEDARRACEVLGIPFYVFDFEKEYKEKVVEYMVNGYRSGITPNPDVMCNHEIKFGLFFERAMAMGADFVATGHYARVRRTRASVASSKYQVVSKNAKIKVKQEYQLLAGVDKNKDQSYFLWMLTERQLAKTIFPIGGLKKSKVRQIAKKFHLHNAEKKDSQGVCFLGQITLDAFLADFIPKKKGKILDESGELLGTHGGVHNFTIGQRHGFGVGGFSEPHYVAEKDIKTNTLVLTPRGDKRVKKREIILGDTNFIDEALGTRQKAIGKTKEKKGEKVLLRFRYRQPLQRAHLLQVKGPTTAKAMVGRQMSKVKGQFKIVFEKPQEFIASGQSAVIYDLKGERVLGGGVIYKAL